MATSGPIRVLIVDDSALMRKLLKDLLGECDEVEVVGMARDGEQALTLATEMKPDVITLDVEMPGRSGLEILPDLLAIRPFPVLMISSLTQEGAETTLAALSLGAVDYLPKPTSHQLAQMRVMRDLLIAKVKAAAKCRVQRSKKPSDSTAIPVSRAAATTTSAHFTRRSTLGSKNQICVVVGISTGGPQALDQVIPFLKPPLPPIVIVQHMPGTFTKVLAKRLAKSCAVPVLEAEDGMRVLPDQILIAAGGHHLSVIGQPPIVKAILNEEPPVSGHRPSIDVLFRSAARTYGAGAIGIIMTGMGRDGVDGCRAILDAGGTTYGQDEATSIVYGMNKAAWVESALTRQFSLEEFPAIIHSISHGT